MYILSPTGMRLYNTRYIREITITVKPDHVRLYAWPAETDRAPHTLARYASLEEAAEAFRVLCGAIQAGEHICQMPYCEALFPKSAGRVKLKKEEDISQEHRGEAGEDVHSLQPGAARTEEM